MIKYFDVFYFYFRNFKKIKSIKQFKNNFKIDNNIDLMINGNYCPLKLL